MRARTLAWGLALCAAVPAAARAQVEVVGVAPSRSPYRDISDLQNLSVFAGRFAGDVGNGGVGARPGLALGARLDVRLSGPVAFWVSAGEAVSSHRVLTLASNGTVDSIYVAGTNRLTLLAADLGLGLDLTGRKTWHGLAPYVGIGLGVIAPTRAVTDSLGFRIGATFTLVPTVGTRWFVSRDVALQVEARDYYFKYAYPLGFFDTPFKGPPPRASLMPTSMTNAQWTHNVTLWVGLSYGFTF